MSVAARAGNLRRASSLRIGVALLAVLASGAVGEAAGARASAPISCALARTLKREQVRPVWFPRPQPPGLLKLNAFVPLFGPGLEWRSGQRYLFLGRVPGGANLGEPFPTQVADPYLANFRSRIRVWRLAKVEGSRLFANWQTFAHNRLDISYAAADGESLSRFSAFLGSLEPITWPRC